MGVKTTGVAVAGTRVAEDGKSTGALVGVAEEALQATNAIIKKDRANVIFFMIIL
jgi:hypothetical protein